MDSQARGAADAPAAVDPKGDPDPVLIRVDGGRVAAVREGHETAVEERRGEDGRGSDNDGNGKDIPPDDNVDDERRDYANDRRSDDSTTTPLEDGSERTACLYVLVDRYPCIRKRIFAWPRTNAVVFGILVPMLLLIVVSVIFGYVLAVTEAPNEIATNNQYLATRAQALQRSAAVQGLLRIVPNACLASYFANDTSAESVRSLILQYAESQANATISVAVSETNGNATTTTTTTTTTTGQQALDDRLPAQEVVVNATDLAVWFDTCTGQSARFIEEWAGGRVELEDACDALSLSFNWIRCAPIEDQGTRDQASIQDIYLIQPEEQEEFYIREWDASQRELFRESVLEFVSYGNVSDAEAYSRALRYSYARATGAARCAANTAAAGWFWFVTMTTIGYGNVVPQTQSGRAMVYAFGFVTVLLWGWLLSFAGYITHSIVADALVRLRFRVLTIPWVYCAMFGFVFFSWLAVIGIVTVNWKRERLFLDDFTMGDGYWFGYISSTTIGYGDIYLESEVFLYRDLVTFPLLFLVAFVIAAAFLGSLQKSLTFSFGRRSIIEDLMKKLKTIHTLPGTGHRAEDSAMKNILCCKRNRHTAEEG